MYLIQPANLWKPVTLQLIYLTRNSHSGEKAQEYIMRGEIFQIVLSRSWKKTSLAEPMDVFLALRQVNPSPICFLLRYQT